MGIKDLNQGSLTTASQIPFYDPNNGCDRRDSVADLIALIAANQVEASGGLVTQYYAPAANNFGTLVAPPVNGESVWLLMTPTAGFALGAITLPLQASCIDGQQILVTSTQAVTTLTVNGNGSTVNGAPTSLAANGFFRLRFDGTFKAWFRIA